MGPDQAISTCFRKYFDFSGRASRPEFWWFTLFAVTVSLVAQLVEWIINTATGSSDGPRILSTVLGLALFVPSLSVAWRRLHDTGHPGWIYPAILLLGPFLSLILVQLLLGIGAPIAIGVLPALAFAGCAFYLLYLLLRPSVSGKNKYGPNPNEVTP